MRFEAFSFGSIRIDGITYNHDVIIDRGELHKRKKKASKRFRDDFGHTPLSVEERIPWKCRSLVIGTGTGALPVTDEVKQEARRRKIELRILPTAQALELLKVARQDTNAILHVAC
jgi:hypothetical protein